MTIDTAHPPTARRACTRPWLRRTAAALVSAWVLAATSDVDADPPAPPRAPAAASSGTASPPRPRPAKPAPERFLIGHMEPLPSERLPEPIVPAGCRGLHVLEWRATPGRAESSGPTEANVALFGALCARAIDQLVGYATWAREVAAALRDGTLVVRVSLMPAKLGFYGEMYRNLNDHPFRFRERTRRYENDGSVMGVWGYTHYEPLAIYMRNDIRDLAGRMNLGFAATLAHEIFHVASYVSRAYDARPGTRAQRDQAEEADAIRYEAHVRW